MRDCFCGGAVVPHLKSRDKFTAIRETIRRAPVFSALGNLAELEEAVIEMEKTRSTGLGRGVAIAHGASPEVDEVRIALGISERGIDFDSVDDIPVRYLFVIVHPPEMQMEYLIALAAVVRMIRDRVFRESLDPTLPTAVLEEMVYRAFRGCLRFYQRTVA